MPDNFNAASDQAALLGQPNTAPPHAVAVDHLGKSFCRGYVLSTAIE